MKFEELEFKPHSLAVDLAELYADLKQAHYETPNGYVVSVIFGALFYSNGVNTYEVWFKGKQPIGAMYDNPAGYLTEADVEKYINGVIDGTD